MIESDTPIQRAHPCGQPMAANRPKGVFFFDFGGDEPQLADLDKSIRQIVVCLLQFLVFHRELPGQPFMGYSFVACFWEHTLSV